MKISSLAIIVFVIILVSGAFFWKEGYKHCRVNAYGGDWFFEIARTPDEHARGLMHRKTLCDRCGMLFIFDQEKPQTFWMKDTYIPLDIYFYSAQGKLVDVARNMRPYNETKDPMLFRSKPSQFVVEVVADSIFPGNSIDILQCK